MPLDELFSALLGGHLCLCLSSVGADVACSRPQHRQKGRSAMNYEWVFLGVVWFLVLLCIVTLGIALSDLMQL